jgi:hypothetical protein
MLRKPASAATYASLGRVAEEAPASVMAAVLMPPSGGR